MGLSFKTRLQLNGNILASLASLREVGRVIGEQVGRFVLEVEMANNGRGTPISIWQLLAEPIVVTVKHYSYYV